MLKVINPVSKRLKCSVATAANRAMNWRFAAALQAFDRLRIGSAAAELLDAREGDFALGIYKRARRLSLVLQLLLEKGQRGF